MPIRVKQACLSLKSWNMSFHVHVRGGIKVDKMVIEYKNMA
jgi:hypothetical protein